MAIYHLTTVARQYKNYTKFESMPHLMHYMETAFASDVFKATDYPCEWILEGWANIYAYIGVYFPQQYLDGFILQSFFFEQMSL